MLKKISTTLSFTMAIAIVALSTLTKANARVCVHYVGGDCIIWTGSVEGELTANELGDIINKPKSLELTVSPMGPGLLFCRNPDFKNKEPKRILLEPKTVIKIGKFGGSETIRRRNVDKCSETALVSVFARLNDTQLRTLDESCKREDKDLEAIDFVPSMLEATVLLTENESKEKLDEVILDCDLPDWKNLRWEKNKPERRPYKCHSKSKDPNVRY